MILKIKTNTDGTKTAVGGDLDGCKVELVRRTCSICGDEVWAWTNGTDWETTEENQCSC